MVFSSELDIADLALDQSLLHSSAFHCLCSWTRTGGIPPAQVVSTPIFQIAMQGLRESETFDAAVDLLCDTIESASGPNSPLVAEKIFQSVSYLRELYTNALAAEDEDSCRGIGNIVVSTGESFASQIIENPQAAEALLQLMVLVSGNRSLTIAKMTFRFWYMLSEKLQPPDVSGVAVGIAERAAIAGFFCQLIRVIVRQHLRYPLDSEQWSKSELDEFKDFRHSVGDVLRDCSAVLGNLICLQEIQSCVVQAQNEGTWQAVEAPLFAIRSIVGLEPANSPILEPILEFLPSLTKHPKVLYTSILIVGRTAEWLALHPSHIETQISFVLTGLTDPTVVSASAVALHYIMDSCAMVCFVWSLVFIVF